MKKTVLLCVVALLTTVTLHAQCTSMTMSMSDSFGDGWNGATYTITDTQTGVVVASGSLNTAATGDGMTTGSDFPCLNDGCYSIFVGGGSWDMEISWSLTNTAAGTIFGSAPQTVTFDVGAGCGGGGNPGGGCDNYTFSAFGGTFDSEISWNILDENGVLQSTGITTTGVTLCLEPGCYTVEMFDSFGDGWNGANWQFLDSGGNLVDLGTLTTGSVGSATVALGGASCGGGGNPGGGGPAIVVDGNTYLAEQLISDVFLGDCLEASNISFTGAATQVGAFSNGSGIGIEEGIILTSGNITGAPGPNVSLSFSEAVGTAGNVLLTNLAGMPTNDAAVFTFDFTASTDEVSFTYVFASEEYPEFTCSSFNDAFGFFVSGPGYAPNTNIATIPGTPGIPVTIDNVNNDPFCTPNYPAYYVDNTGGTAVEYDGYTTPLTATINTVPCETYQITIAVADAGDAAYDSAVFLQAQSFTAGINVEVAAVNLDGIQSTPASCGEGGVFTFVNDGEPFTEDVTLTFTIGGTASAGDDYDPVPTQITFPAGTTILEIPIDGIVDQLPETPQTVTLQLDQTCTCSPPPEITLYLCAQLFLPVEWNGFIAEASQNKWQVECQWSTSSELNNDHFRIERSVDAANWQTVGFADSQDEGAYSFVDHSPKSGEAYYRIVQVDYNGSETATGPRRVLLEDRHDDLSVYPNPGNGIFRLQNWSGQEIAVRNTNGQEVPFELSELGELHLSVAPGVYFIESYSEAGTIGRARLVVR